MDMQKREELLRQSMIKNGQDISKTFVANIRKDKKANTGKIGRPARIDRPAKSSAKRTLPGEERYTVTIKTTNLQAMKTIAESGKYESLKDAYNEAIEAFIKKNGYEI